MELRTGKKENVMRIWRLSFSLRSVLKFWTLVMYNLVDRSPVTACHAPLHQNSEVRNLKVMNFTVFAFRLILLGILNGEGVTSSQTWQVMQGSTNFPKLYEPPANLGPRMVTSILSTHNFELSCKPHRFPSLSAPCMRIAMYLYDETFWRHPQNLVSRSSRHQVFCASLV